MNIPQKHSGKTLTIFSEMTALAIKHNAVNLSQGFPDFEIHPRLKKFLAEATEQNHNQYAPMQGNPQLVENIENFNQNRKQPIYIDKTEITVTPGATYGIFCALATIILPGDEIIVLEPGYDSYIPAIETNGGTAVTVALNENFEPDFEKIKDAITEKTKAIIVNSPHNPSGKIWTKNDWENLWQIIKDQNIFVISDEVYDVLVYDENEFTSVFHHPELRSRSFAIFSFGKMFHATGWKVGYVLASEELSLAFRKIHQYLGFSVNAPSQQALANYLEIFEVEQNRKFLQDKRDFFISEFRDLPFRFSQKAEGGYFQIAEYLDFHVKDDKKFAVWLTENKKVATVPVSAFFKDEKNTGQVRFCFAKKEETVMKAVENLKKL